MFFLEVVEKFIVRQRSILINIYLRNKVIKVHTLKLFAEDIQKIFLRNCSALVFVKARERLAKHIFMHSKPVAYDGCQEFAVGDLVIAICVQALEQFFSLRIVDVEPIHKGLSDLRMLDGASLVNIKGQKNAAQFPM